MDNKVLDRDTAVLLAALGGASPFETRGRVLESSGRWLRLGTREPLPPGTPVRLDGKDTLLLGEVGAVDGSGEDWVVTVEIAHSLAALAELERFNRALLGRPPEKEAALSPSLRSASE